ncbi:MAG: class I SAM-dependent methyltransferase [Prolixibacteraceae bacterium]
MITVPAFDPIGNAISNYYYHKDNTPITVSSVVVEDEQLPPDYFFRAYNDMPMLERLALKHATGNILDIGAGAGCHALYLQKVKKKVTALEISELCCKVMRDRGITKVINSDILSFTLEKYDTILLLMNGIGISGSIKGLESLLLHLKKLINPHGKILLDSSDLMYLFEQEDGSFLFDINAENYYGEIDYLLKYKKILGQPFSWLFADYVILSDLAEQCGYRCKVLEYGPHYDYLAELTLI